MIFSQTITQMGDSTTAFKGQRITIFLNVPDQNTTIKVFSVKDPKNSGIIATFLLF